MPSTARVLRREPLPANAFDVVVVGSGVGGLTCAAYLALSGARLLVVDQHYTAGGYAHGFKRAGYHFDAAVHYIGECGPGGLIPRVLMRLGVADRVRFVEMDPDGFDHIHLPGQVFRVPAGLARYRARLRVQFPGEAEGITRYCAVMQEVWDALRALRAPRAAFTAAHRTALVRWGEYTLEQLLDELRASPRLRAILAATRLDYGVNPARAALFTHVAVMMHYLEGAYYPSGGSQALVDALVGAIVQRGGQVWLRAPVEQILVEGGRAAGVRLGRGLGTVKAGAVISNADIWATFGKLVDPLSVPEQFRQSVEALQPSPAGVSVYLGTDLDLKAQGLGSQNVWLQSGDRVDGEVGWEIDPGMGEDLPPPPSLLVSSSSLKDPAGGHAPPGHHALTLFTMASPRTFERWRGTRWKRRGPDYDAFKERIAWSLIRLVDRSLLHGLAGRVTFHEVASPLTNTHFAWASAGACYGPDQVPAQVGQYALGPETPIPGLWLAGANRGGFMGVSGAAWSGATSAAAILGQHVSTLL